MPALRVFLNLDNLTDLRADSVLPASLLTDVAARDARLAADGFEGVQVTYDAPALEPGSTLPHCGLCRINLPAEADALHQLTRKTRRQRGHSECPLCVARPAGAARPIRAIMHRP